MICTRAYFIFLSYINDLEEGITGTIFKFAEKLRKLEININYKMTLIN